ncbi:MAG TPA: hypothetical protein VLB79_01310 [Solirubrobacterales bacterium]|nr:hypothetical protein [Solirubrobacterales bacterium]
MADEQQQEGAGAAPEGPSEEELRAQLEEEIRRVRVEDVVLQSAVSILNLSARRIAKDDERDLDQAKVGIDAARALVELVKPEAQPQLRQAISELQLLYAKHAGEGPAEDEDGEGGDGAETPPEQGRTERPKGDSGLWTPPGS